MKLVPIKERPREKLISYGAHSLSDSELLAIFLNTGTKEKSVLSLAQDVLSHYSSFAALLNASHEDLKNMHGIGEAKAVTLQAILELCHRYLWEHACQEPVTNTSLALKKYLQLKLKNRDREVFVCLFLSTQMRIIHYEEVFQGTLTQVPVYPREIVKLALRHNAYAIVLGHNHPTGEAKPSHADLLVTAEIKHALHLFDIQLVDHIIIAQEKTYAFSEHGDLL